MPGIWWYAKRNEWCADVPDPEEPKKRVRRYLGPDKQKALQQLHHCLAEYYGQDPVHQAAPQRLTLFSLTAKFLSWAETNLSEATQDVYTCQLKPFVERHGNRAAEDIAPSDVEEHKTTIKRAGNRPRTINFFVQSIKRLYSWAVDQDLISDNPIRKVKRVPSAPHQDKSLSQETVQKFLACAASSQPLGDFSELLLLTGMRAGELLKLRWTDIDFDRKVARIFQHKTAQRGEQRPRTIPLCTRAVEIIRSQPELSEYVFTGDKGQPLSYSALKCRKDRLEDKHPDMPQVTFHQFRHTAASRMAQAGIPERVAQEILGHSSVLMTRYYTTTPIAEMLDAVEKVAEANRSSG